MEVEKQLARCARRPAAAGERETLNGVPTRVEVRSEAFSDAGSTPAASTIFHRVVSPICATRSPRCHDFLVERELAEAVVREGHIVYAQ